MFKFLLILILVGISNISCQVTIPNYKDLVKNVTAQDLSVDCILRLGFFAEGLINLEPWAFKIIDSSSTIPAGILTGNIYEMGNFDECIEAGDESKTVHTKFCKVTTNFQPNEVSNTKPQINYGALGLSMDLSILNMMQFYICIPKLCPANEMQSVFQDFFQFDEDNCSTNETPDLDPLAVVATILFSTILCLSIASTILELFMVYQLKSEAHQIITVFSLYTNSKKLFSTNNQQFACLNGIKSLSMIWIVIGHIYMTFMFVPLTNYLHVWDWLKSSHSQFITGTTIAVDSFLVVAGYLNLYNFQKSMDKGENFNIFSHCIHRYIRLTPSLAAMLLAHIAIFNYMGEGPIWSYTDTFLSKACKEYWWSTLLYIQNYVNPSEICIPQSWYLSLDMQLFLISSILLTTLRKYTLWSCIGLGLVCLASIIGGFMVAWSYSLSGVLTVQGNGSLADYMEYYYMPTHTRLSPYFFGIILACIVYNLKKSDIILKFTRVQIIMMWTLSIVLILIGLLGGQSLEHKDFSIWESSFFIALSRPTWAIGVCLLIFYCVMGWGGIINSFLSLKIFQILSKISYSIYMVHYSFLFLTSFSLRSPLTFSDYNSVHKFWGDFVFVTVISILWTLLFEYPVTALEKLIKDRKQTEKKKIII